MSKQPQTLMEYSEEVHTGKLRYENGLQSANMESLTSCMERPCKFDKERIAIIKRKKAKFLPLNSSCHRAICCCKQSESLREFRNGVHTTKASKKMSDYWKYAKFRLKFDFHTKKIMTWISYDWELMRLGETNFKVNKMID